jgi:serine/threonine-protein kinase
MMPIGPARLGNYEPLLELASGGMGTVYVARQVGAAGFERLVVMKRVHRHHMGNREFLTMLRDEAHLASMVKHPNVVPVIDVVEADGELALVMEYVESTALSSLLKLARADGEQLPMTIAVRILADALSGLQAAHEAVDMRGQRLDIIHRDVSPQNIIVGLDGSSRLIDFGVAKATHRLTQTRSDSLKGKLGYMAPEQVMGLTIDRRIDIFAAGVALHEALVGRRLFTGENDFDTMRRILEMPLPRPSELVPGLPPKLDDVVMRALEREPEKRFQTAAEMLEALEAAVTPAPLREVAAYVRLRCGPRMSERRIKLRSLLEGRAAPLTLTPVPPPDSNVATQGSLASTVAPARLRSNVGPGSADIVVVEGTTVASRGRGWVMWLALAASFVLVLGGAAIAWKTRAKRMAAAATEAPTVAETSEPKATIPANTATATATTPAADGVEIRVSADTTILSVRALGMKRVNISGESATVVVAPWTGLLEVEAVLADGRDARVQVDARGSREVKLQAAAKRPPAGSKIPKAAAGPKPASKPQQPAGDRSELHDSPY